MGEIHVGTSGWHYPGGRGSWDGIFYPLPGDRPKGFDELSFYAERFDTVEVNSTFYGQPRATVSLGWVRRTPANFTFAVKLFQKFTHPVMTSDASAVARADIDAFKAGIDPLVAAGRLGPVLAQFPARFKDSPAAREYLAWLLGAFAEYGVAVELRHRSWSDAEMDVAALLDAAQAAWVQIDEPKFDSSIRQDWTPRPGALAYARFHGRNAAQWWDHAAAEDRYNYLYSEHELTPIVERLQQARATVKKLYLFMNNHYSAQAVANATMVRHLVDDPITVRMPGELVQRYPMLAGKVATFPASRLL